MFVNPSNSKAAPIVTALAAFALAGAAATFLSPGHALAAPATSRAHSQAMPAGLRSAFYTTLAREAGPAYALNGKGCMQLPRQKLGACFNKQGAHFKLAGAPFALHLTAWGRAGALASVHATKPVITGQHVSYAYGDVTESWRALPVGFEQTFTIDKRPAGHGRLTLMLTASRQDAGASEDGVLAWGKLHYGKLVVTDAKGKVIPATLKSKGDRILIAINDAHAAYPLMVDPLVWLGQKVTAGDVDVAGIRTPLSFGKAVAISGNTAIVGAFTATVEGNVDEGAVYVFTKSDGTWVQTQKLVSSDGAAFDFFGWSVALEGGTALVGATVADEPGYLNQGAVYVFTKSNGIWKQTQKLSPRNGLAGAAFGFSVALDGTTALIGARQATVRDDVIEQGAAYVFTKSDGVWVQTQELIAPDAIEGAFFGEAVALDGAWAVIGAPGASSAYFFKDSSGTWSLAAEFNKRGVHYGESVALDGTVALVGAPAFTDPAQNPPNAVYVYTESNDIWTQTQELTRSKGRPFDLFGFSVALDGNAALVGSPNADGLKVHRGPGAAYLFTRKNGTWSQARKFTPSDDYAEDNYGSDVALVGSIALIGADSSVVNGKTLEGASYFYGRTNLGLAVSAPQLLAEGRQYKSQTIATNNASAASPATVVAIKTPAAVSFVSATAAQGSCGEDSGVVTCNFGAINGNGGQATADVTYKVSRSFGHQVIKNAASMTYANPPLSTSVRSVVDSSPIASDGSLKTQRHEAADGILQATDADGDPLTFSIVSPPAHGHVTINDVHKGFYAYTPDAGYTTGDSFTFKANDGFIDSNIATVIINVEDRSPVASDGSLTTDQNTPVKGALRANDPDGDSLTYGIVAPPGHGSITLDAATGAYTYEPATGYIGSDSFTFNANDGQSDSNIATVSIKVKGDAPPPPPPPSDNDSGGGGFGGVLLMLLGALAAATAWLRSIARKPNVALKEIIAFGLRPRSRPGAASAAIRSNLATHLDSFPLAEEEEIEGGIEKRRDVRSLAKGEGEACCRQKCRETTLQRCRGRFACTGLRGLTHANGLKGQLVTECKEMNMRTYGKWITATASGVLALALIAGLSFVPTSSAAPGHSATALHHKPSGLTKQSIKIARESGLPSPLVTMAPQSSLKLLSRATKIGPHALGSTIKLTVGLKLRNEAKLKSFLEQVQNPRSAVYHQWLTPAEFTRLYGPTKADVAKVTAFLKAHHIKVLNVSSNRLLIHTEATTGIYERAFEIRINDYQLDGRRFYSTTDSPIIPRALDAQITGILGLNHGVQMHPHHFIRPLGAAARGANPHTPPPVSLTYYNPLQIATAYNVPDIRDKSGANVAIAIATAESQGVSSSLDFSNFWSDFGLPDHTINEIDVDGSPGTGGKSETWLDIEYAGAMGPGATLNVYIAANALFVTFTDTYNKIVEDNRSAVMTTSWGIYESAMPEGQIETDEQIFMQGAAQGISMFAAAGDDGTVDRNPDGSYNADYPSTSAYITAANGTQLNVSDLAGDYGSEVVWNDTGCGSTGGAISDVIARPDWQTGPGAPTGIDKRMNSDVALTASCSKPMLTLNGGTWFGMAGTSAVAPQLAGIFAIAVALQNSRLGQSNKLFYNDVNAGHYATDFHDITEGCNGKLPNGSHSCAAVNWDHPTGWGSLNARNLISHITLLGPHGTLIGKVTAAATGSAIAGAAVTAVADDGTKYTARTAGDGTYSRLLPTGDFTVTVSDYGYLEDKASLSIGDGKTIKRDFSLETAPTVTLSGKVTDGSGHGYGLYADVKVSALHFPQVAEVWTNPKTGKYSVKVPGGTTYNLHVAAAFDGYNTTSKTVTPSGNEILNIALTAANVCTAPGYQIVNNGGLSEDFNGGTFPPAGWAVVPPAGTAIWGFWKSTSQIPSPGVPGGHLLNRTGGTGDAATAFENVITLSPYPYDTSLVTPPIPVTSLQGANATLRYKGYYVDWDSFGWEAFDLDISTDSGKSWRTISHWTTSHSSHGYLAGVDVSENLAPYLPASGSFQLRWRYYNPYNALGRFAQIDDVVVGRCEPIAGGLVYGQVTDANTGKALTGVTVADDVGDSAKTVENPADPAFPQGSYLLFTRRGAAMLTASASDRRYTSASIPFTVAKGQIKTQDFALKAARLAAEPDSLTLHARVNDLTTATLALKNAGSGNGKFKIWAINLPLSTGSSASMPYTSVAPISTFSPGFSMRMNTGLVVDRNASDLWLENQMTTRLNELDRYQFNGTNTGDVIGQVSFPRYFDMAFDVNTGMLWQIVLEGANVPRSSSSIVGFDPTTMKSTDNSILIPNSELLKGLAFDPLSNTWFAGGDFDTGTMLYHVYPSGNYVSPPVALTGMYIVGLAYNPATEHLFVLSNADFYRLKTDYAIQVFDAKHGYKWVKAIKINGFPPDDFSTGFDYDCNGNLWLTDYRANLVLEVPSGETGWCVKQGIPWLTLSPEEGTVKAGASTKLTLAIDGTGKKEFTTSQVQLAVTGYTPYPVPRIPVTVIWGPQPVNLSLTGGVAPSLPRKGNTLLYTLTVRNQHANNHGAATRVKLTYPLPQGVSYVAASGDATCTVPPSTGSAPAVGATSTDGSPANTVSCNFGTIALGDSKTETLAVKVVAAGKLTSAFTISAREPDSDGDNNSLTLSSDVIGTADLVLNADKASIPAGGTGALVLTLNNNGPDPASAVQVRAKVGGDAVHLQSASASQGQCSLSGGAVTCDLGQVNVGDPATVKLQLFGAYAGSTTINAQVSTASDEPDSSGNGATAQVTVTGAKSPGTGDGNNGGGAFGWFALAALLGLGLTVVARRRRVSR